MDEVDRRSRSWDDRHAIVPRALACNTPASPIGVLAALAMDASKDDALQHLQALTTLLVVSFLATERFNAERSIVLQNLTSGELDCMQLVGAVT